MTAVGPRLILPTLVLLIIASVGRMATAASLRHYVLQPQSTITVLCRDCGTGASTEAQTLSGSFDLTMLPLEGPEGGGVAALSNLRLASASHRLVGSGFVQRIGLMRQQMILEAEIDGEKVLLSSGRRQAGTGQRIELVLAHRGGLRTYIVSLVAAPGDATAQDADADTVADQNDNCPQLANTGQGDSDRDQVGDACDECPASDLRDAVTAQGCSARQACPCEGPRSGGVWQSRGQYLMCIGREMRALRRAGKVSRREAMRAIREAAASGCGRIVLALR